MKAVDIKKLREEILEVVNIEYQMKDEFDVWDGSLSEKGMMRMIHGIWNNGKNELEEDMVEMMPSEAKEMYYKLINKYKDYNPVLINERKPI